MNRHMNRIFLLLTILVAMVAWQIPCVAQQVVVQLNANNDGREQFDELMDNLKGGMEFRLNSRIRDLESICELNGEQARKLRVAAKGAVGEVMETESEKLMKTLRQYQQQAGFDVEKLDREREAKANGSEKNGSEEEVGDEDDEDDDDDQVIRNFAFVLMAPLANSIESSSLWEKSLEKVLTEEQTKAYEDAQSERDEFYKRAAVDRFVAGVEMKLFLTPDQRESVTEVVLKEFGDKLVDQLKFEELNRNRGLQVRNGLAPDPEYEDLVRDILTEEQLNEWNRSIEPLLLNLKRIRRQ